jgi:hypothetical protein
LRIVPGVEPLDGDGENEALRQTVLQHILRARLDALFHLLLAHERHQRRSL